jgi:Holliday junction resolvase
MSTPEGRIKRRLATRLKELGVWYFCPANNGLGTSGIPDFIAIVGGQFIGIECKADPTKQPTELQKKQGERIKTAGGEWYLVRSYDDIDEVTICLSLKKQRPSH